MPVSSRHADSRAYISRCFEEVAPCPGSERHCQEQEERDEDGRAHECKGVQARIVRENLSEDRSWPVMAGELLVRCLSLPELDSTESSSPTHNSACGDECQPWVSNVDGWMGILPQLTDSRFGFHRPFQQRAGRERAHIAHVLLGHAV